MTSIVPKNGPQQCLLILPYHSLSFNIHHAHVLKAEKIASILASILTLILVSMSFSLLLPSIMPLPILLSHFHKLSFVTHHAYVLTAEKIASILASISFYILHEPLMDLHQYFLTQTILE